MYIGLHLAVAINLLVPGRSAQVILILINYKCKLIGTVCCLKLLVGAQVLENLCWQPVLCGTWNCKRDIIYLILWTSGPCVPDSTLWGVWTILTQVGSCLVVWPLFGPLLVSLFGQSPVWLLSQVQWLWRGPVWLSRCIYVASWGVSMYIKWSSLYRYLGVGLGWQAHLLWVIDLSFVYHLYSLP